MIALVLMICQFSRANFDLLHLGVRIFNDTCPDHICKGVSCSIINFQRAHCEVCDIRPTCDTTETYYFGK